MASFKIEGGHLLHGEIRPQGAKNEALQVICATLLTCEEVTIHNIPNIRDVNNLIQLLRDIGVKVKASPSPSEGGVSAGGGLHLPGRPAEYGIPAERPVC